MIKDEALLMAIEAINNLSSCIDDKYMELTRGEDWHDRYVIKPIEACKEALQPDRTGLTYFKIDACKAQDANSADCICWTPKQPESVVKDSLTVQKPLSRYEIIAIDVWIAHMAVTNDLIDFARAIEKAHGIGE